MEIACMKKKNMIELSSWFLKHTSDFVVLLSPKANIVDISKAALRFYKITWKSTIGADYFKLLHELGAQPVISKSDFKKMAAGRENVMQRHIVSSWLGKKYEIEWSFTRVETHIDGAYQYVLLGKISAKKDITEDKKIKDPQRKEMVGQVLKKQLAILSKLNQEILGGSAKEYQTVEEYFYAISHHYQTIIACMPGNVYWMDKNCVYLGCNDNVARMMGMKSAKEAVGVTYDIMATLSGWDKGQEKSFQHDDKEVLKTGNAKLNVEEPEVKNKRGESVYYLTSRVPLRDEGGEIAGVVGISIDITERKKMEQALRKAKEAAEASNRAKTEFLANMSHDIKTPLSGIISIAELLARQLEGDDLNLVRDILSSGQQLMTFFSNCIELSKVEHGDITLEKQLFAPKSIIEEIAALFQPTIKAKGLALNIKYDVKIPSYLFGVRINVYRVLLNLVGNAIKFTDTGSITIKAELSKKSTPKKAVLIFSIKDTGIGIPKNKQKAIFERFAKLTSSYKGIYEGSGIGLYIVQEFVRAMHGKVQVVSSEGKGSEFTVTLPLEISLTQNKRAPVPPPPQIIIDESVRGANVLLVEDNEMLQNATSSLLASLQCHVDIAENGNRAITLFKPGKYDLIFMDIGLPDMKGYEVAKRLRAMEQGNGRVPILALSAHVAEDFTRHEAERDLDAYLTKPLLYEQAQRILLQHFYRRQPAAPDKQTSPQLVDYSRIIDLPLGMYRLGKGEAEARSMLAQFVASLPAFCATMEKAYKARNIDKLIDTAHKMYGGLCLIGAPQLQNAVGTLELTLQRGEIKQLEVLYQEFLQALNTFREVYHGAMCATDKAKMGGGCSLA